MAALEQIQGDASDDEVFVEVPLDGQMLRIKRPEDWPASAIRAVREGDFDTWAEKCLVDDDYQIWSRVDPVLSQVEEFFLAVKAEAGIDPKGSRNSRRSSNSSRPRSKRT